jgi:hypothetical protein
MSKGCANLAQPSCTSQRRDQAHVPEPAQLEERVLGPIAPFAHVRDHVLQKLRVQLGTFLDPNSDDQSAGPFAPHDLPQPSAMEVLMQSYLLSVVSLYLMYLRDRTRQWV